jgi:hypothetical protein
VTTFADAVTETAPRKGPQCTVCQLAESLDGHPERDTILAAIAGGMQLNHLARALAKFTGDEIWSGRGGTLSKHRASHLSR